MLKNIKNAVCDMEKTRNLFVILQEMTIFADAIIGKVGLRVPNAILHDRLTTFDLAKSGKFITGVKMSLVKPVLYPYEGTDCFTIFVTPGIFQNLARQMWMKLGRALLLSCRYRD